MSTPWHDQYGYYQNETGAGGIGEAEVQALIDAAVADTLTGEAHSELDHAPGAWESYTPTWVATSGTLVLGSGVVSGRYLIVGKTMHFSINCQFAADSSFADGAGTLGFTLPSGVTGRTGIKQIVVAYYYDNGVAHRRGVGSVTSGANRVENFFLADSTTTPWAIGGAQAYVSNGDRIDISGTIEID